jgi:hypothetical protein
MVTKTVMRAGPSLTLPLEAGLVEQMVEVFA